MTVAVVAGAFVYLKLKNSGELTYPQRRAIVEYVYGLGTVVAPQSHQIKSAINQVISEIYVEEGDSIASGAPILKLGESGVQRAPFAGTITMIPFKKGEVLFPSVAAATLVNLQSLILEVSLEQQAVMRVQAQQTAVISFESIRGQKIESRVQTVFPRENQFIVRIPLSPIPSGVLPGMTADVAIEVGRKDNALTVPTRAISNGQLTAWKSNKKIKVPVTIGIMDGEWAEITSGNLLESEPVLLRRH